MPSMQTSADRNIEHLAEPFRDAYQCVLRDMQTWLDVHLPGYEAFLLEGLRSAEYQHSLYLKGRPDNGPIVTQNDGYQTPSNHQSGLAADLGIRTQDQYAMLWNWPATLTAYYGHLVRLYGLKWGGDWSGFKDIAHAEWPRSDAKTYSEAQAWLKSEGLA